MVSLSLLLICAIEQAAIMVVEEIIRSRPRRRASPWLAEGLWSSSNDSALTRAGGLRIP